MEDEESTDADRRGYNSIKVTSPSNVINSPTIGNTFTNFPKQPMRLGTGMVGRTDRGGGEGRLGFNGGLLFLRLFFSFLASMKPMRDIQFTTSCWGT
jgi:hypothetical protein